MLLQVKTGEELSAAALAKGCTAKVDLVFMHFVDGTNFANRNGAETMAYSSVVGQSEMLIAGAMGGKDNEASQKQHFCHPPMEGVLSLYGQLEEFIRSREFEVEMDPAIFNGRTGKMLVHCRSYMVLDQPASNAAAGGGVLCRLEYQHRIPADCNVICAAAKGVSCMGKVFSPFTWNTREQLQMGYAVIDIKAGIMYCPVVGAICIHSRARTADCNCPSCRFK